MERIAQFFDPPSSTLTYVLFDDETREAALVDGVDRQIERDLGFIATENLELKWVLETHVHADHITSAAEVARRTRARTAAPASCDVPVASKQLLDGMSLPLGEGRIHVLHTPGHTAGSMCYRWGDAILTGDTLFIGGCGRTDFQGGSADKLWHSVTGKLFALPDDIRVLPGHDYNGKRESTIGHEKRTNPRLAGKSLEEFRAIMAGLNLPKPKLIDIAVPANRVLGAARHDA
ncbi:MAG: MBL fold metallo-hydrolase [Nitrosomonadaceae bacterium]|jgi:sulfur dioxygenase|nr:MBL fold metallo-hydrolase [Nitrosomonadaceae bacterium]